MSSVIYAWKGTNYLSEHSTDNLTHLLTNPKIYLRFNGFELNDIQEIQRFLTFNDNSREKTVKESINCYEHDEDSDRTPKVKLNKDEFQGIVPSFYLDETTISILKDYSGTVGLPKSVMFFITNTESYEISTMSDEDLNKKVSDITKGTIKANCRHVKTDLTETLITPNFNGVIIYIKLDDRESSLPLLNNIREEIGNKQNNRNHNKLKKNIIISTILASELKLEDKIKLIRYIDEKLADELKKQSIKRQRRDGGKKSKKKYKNKKKKSMIRLNKKSKKNKKTKYYKKLKIKYTKHI